MKTINASLLKGIEGLKTSLFGIRKSHKYLVSQKSSVDVVAL